MNMTQSNIRAQPRKYVNIIIELKAHSCESSEHNFLNA